MNALAPPPLAQPERSHFWFAQSNAVIFKTLVLLVLTIHNDNNSMLKILFRCSPTWISTKTKNIRRNHTSERSCHILSISFLCAYWYALLYQKTVPLSKIEWNARKQRRLYYMIIYLVPKLDLVDIFRYDDEVVEVYIRHLHGDDGRWKVW